MVLFSPPPPAVSGLQDNKLKMENDVNWGIKKRVMKKKNRALQVKKLNASLPFKTRTKITSNSSFFKNSLKHNNKVLAMALSIENENLQQLNNEKLLLQKELDGLNMQNILLRRKLSDLNKALKEIQAFMNNNILTEIELSTFSECIPKPVTMDDVQCSNSGPESKLSKNQIRPTEQYLITPHIVESDGEGKGNLFVCDTDGPFKQIPVLSKEITADYMNMQILYPKQMPKPSEINTMETEFATNTFPEGSKPLQELKNIGINSNPKSKKDIEAHSVPPVRLR